MIIQGEKENEHDDDWKSEWRMKGKQRCISYHLTNTNMHHHA